MRWLILFLLTAQFAAAAPVDACGVVSQQDVEKVMGRPAGKRVEHGGPSHSICEFETREGIVSVAVHEVARDVTLERQQSELAGAFAEARFQGVQVREFRGFLMELPDTGAQVHVLGGNRRYVMVSVLGYPGAGVTARAIASLVAARVCGAEASLQQRNRPN